jgi:uncharacterized protein (DUF1330 family)
MKSYFIAQITINDPKEYEKYLQGFDSIFEKYKGKVLAVDDNPTALEGEWNHTRCVLMEFPNEEELKEWYYSPEYKELVKYRFKASNSDTFIIHGREE